MDCLLKTKKGDVLFRESVRLIPIISQSSVFGCSSTLSLIDFIPNSEYGLLYVPAKNEVVVRRTFSLFEEKKNSLHHQKTDQHKQKKVIGIDTSG